VQLKVNMVAATLSALRDFLNGISNTIWGVILLYVAVCMKMRHVDDAAVYYFAGIGSTLLGVNHGPSTTGNNSGNTIITPEK
jgi:hypothetical protein